MAMINQKGEKHLKINEIKTFIFHIIHLKFSIFKNC